MQLRGKSNIFSSSLARKAQVTLFVIIAMVIVVVGILIYQFAPGLKSTTTGIEENPREFIRMCMEDTLNENIDTIMKNGGMLTPDHPYMYLGEPIDYLCYTSEYRKLCTVENPMLINQVENEIQNSMQETIDSCFDSLLEALDAKGYQTNLDKGNFGVELSQNKLKLEINNSLTVSKKETQSYEKFEYNYNRNLYEVLSVGYNILNWEAAQGDAYVDIYMDLYPDLKVEKIKRGDGTKIYVISEKISDESFRFASRSLAVESGFPMPEE